MKASLIAYTNFNSSLAHQLTGWDTDASGGQALAEMAGRACYASWDKPNPATATNKGYLANIIKQQHHSVLEHGSATFYITGVSRSLTHELIRHRHLSYSELSQRFVDMQNASWILPPAIPDGDTETMQEMAVAGFGMKTAYAALVDKLTKRGKTRKQAREAARAVMPNMTETRIVVTGNYRAWRHFLAVRGTEHADAEIRRLAVDIGWTLKTHAPNIFQDMHLRTWPDGTDTLYFGAHDEEKA